MSFKKVNIIKGLQIEKEKVRTYLFADDMIWHIDNSKESSKNY